MRKRSRVVIGDDPVEQTDGANHSNDDAMDTQPSDPHAHLPWVVNLNGRKRFFCPVQGCPHANLAQARGWGGLLGVKNHLKEHYARRFGGAVPQAFLDAHNLCSCKVCGKIITFRSNGTCPTCHPARRAALANTPAESAESSNTSSLPSLDEICTTRIRLLKYVPRGARPAWGQALAQAAAKVVWHNSIQAWVEWTLWPKCVLKAPPPSTGEV